VTTVDIDTLIERIRGGDIAALGAFVDARRGALLGFIEKQLGPALRRKIEPDDVFQEVSAEAVRGLPAMDLSERDPFSWLCQIAERRIIDAHRRFFGAAKRDAGREVSINRPAADESRAGVIDMLVASMTTASQAFSRNAREARLAEALALLPADQQEALRLRYVQGLPSKQIAQQLGKTDGAVRVMLTRSINRLQAILDPGNDTAG